MGLFFSYGSSQFFDSFCDSDCVVVLLKWCDPYPCYATSKARKDRLYGCQPRDRRALWFVVFETKCNALNSPGSQRLADSDGHCARAPSLRPHRRCSELGRSAKLKYGATFWKGLSVGISMPDACCNTLLRLLAWFLLLISRHVWIVSASVSVRLSYSIPSHLIFGHRVRSNLAKCWMILDAHMHTVWDVHFGNSRSIVFRL
jgi:hypothetical protein